MEPVQVTPPLGHQRPPKRTDQDRYCHCGTRLNQYNPGPACYTHSPRKQPIFRARLRHDHPA